MIARNVQVLKIFDDTYKNVYILTLYTYYIFYKLN